MEIMFIHVAAEIFSACLLFLSSCCELIYRSRSVVFFLRTRIGFPRRYHFLLSIGFMQTYDCIRYTMFSAGLNFQLDRHTMIFVRKIRLNVHKVTNLS